MPWPAASLASATLWLLRIGELHTLPPRPPFDGAQMMGVLHHVEGEEARLELLREVTGGSSPERPSSWAAASARTPG